MQIIKKYEELLRYIDRSESCKDELEHLKSELQEEIEKVDHRISNINHMKSEFMSDCQRADKEGKNYTIPVGELDRLEREKCELVNQLEEMKAFFKKVNQQYSTDLSFNKLKFFANLRYYMKEKDIKIGQIENNAGVQKGYMSRLDKIDSSTDPTIQFVVSAANTVNESLDDLVYGNPAEMSEAENFISKFFKDLLDDTKERMIRWKKVPYGILEKEYNYYNESCEHHPLLVLDELIKDDRGDNYCVHYVSKFYIDKKVDVDGDVFFTKMPNTDNFVYLVPCSFRGEEESKFFEVYITDDEKIINGICNTKQVHPSITGVFNELYKSAMASYENVYVDDDVRNIIEAYQNSRKKA